MKPTVEELVRKALELDEQERAARQLFETKVFDLGPCQVESLDDITEVLAFAEGEAFKR